MHCREPPVPSPVVTARSWPTVVEPMSTRLPMEEPPVPSPVVTVRSWPTVVELMAT